MAEKIRVNGIGIEDSKTEIGTGIAEIPPKESLSADQEAAAALLMKNSGVVIAEMPQHTPESIETAREKVDAGHQENQEAKNDAIANYQKADSDLQRFYKDRNFIMEHGRPDDLTNRMRNLEEKIAKLPTETAPQAEKKPNWLLSKLSVKPKQEENQISPKEKILQELDEIRAMLPQVQEAYGFFNGKNELEMKAARELAKREAEKS